MPARRAMSSTLTGLSDVAARRADQAVDTAFIADLLRQWREDRST